MTVVFLSEHMIYLAAGSENGGDPSKLSFFQLKCQIFKCEILYEKVLPSVLEINETVESMNKWMFSFKLGGTTSLVGDKIDLVSRLQSFTCHLTFHV